jgi:uncharacterized protein
MNNTLMTWGPIQFQIYPLNIHAYEHTSETDWARKEIAGAAIYREWVGENDTDINIHGKVFPHFMSKKMREKGTQQSSGGLGHLDVLDNMRLLGQAHLLMRGDGYKIGWFVMGKFSRGHQSLGSDGIGQQIEFQATFHRVPVPAPETYMAFLWGALNGG